MVDEMEIHGKLDTVIQLAKANLKLSNSIVQYISQSSLNNEKQLGSMQKGLDEKLNELKNDIQELGKLSTEAVHVYSDEELYNLKRTMSWAMLSKKTKIPLSTLQYRHRRYVKEQLDF